MKNQKLWTQEEIDMMAKLRKAGMSLHIIATHLGRSFHSVKQKYYGNSALYEEGHPDKRLWQSDEIQLLHDLVGFKTASEMASILYRSPTSVQRKMNKLGLSYRQAKARLYRAYNPVTKQAAKALANIGHTPTEIMQLLNLDNKHYHQVRDLVAREKIKNEKYT